MKRILSRRTFIGTASAGALPAGAGAGAVAAPTASLPAFRPRESDADADVFAAARRRRIERWNRLLNDRLRRGLREPGGVEIRSPRDDALAAAITTFRVEGHTARALQDALWRSRIRVRAQGDENGVRLCSHLYVAPKDIDRVLGITRSLAMRQASTQRRLKSS